jgi:predicted nucleic acid-binding protein
VSDFAAAEFASAIARQVRVQILAPDEARSAFSAFDTWIARKVDLVHTAGVDIGTATAFMRRLDLALRTPDAINIAIALRIDAELLTFDNQMEANARKLGTRIAAE